MRFRALLVMLLPFLFVPAPDAAAEPITFSFAGTILFAGGPVFAVGDHVAGWYRFDSSTPGVIPPDDIGKRYDAVTEFLVDVGLHTITGRAGSITVHFDEPELGGENGYDVRMRDGTGDIPGSSVWDVFLSLFDVTSFPPLVSDDSIQTRPPSLARATDATGTILGRGAYGFSIERFSLVPVPEPATASLLGAGVIAVMALGRRRRLSRKRTSPR